MISPFIADDNRDATISDDGNIIAFISTRDLVTGGNLDADGVPANVPNPEVFIFNRTLSRFTQVTNTKSTSFNNPIFSSNPNLSGNGSVISFISNANLTSNNDDGGGLSNGEIYVANYNGGAGTISGLRQVTRTKNGLPVPAASPLVFQNEFPVDLSGVERSFDRETHVSQAVDASTIRPSRFNSASAVVTSSITSAGSM